MSEQIPVNLLKEGKINDWNEWRSQHSDQHLDLTNTDLSSLDLTGANLSNSNLSGVDLTGTNLQDTDFTEASNIKDIIIRNEKEDDFRNACRLLLKTGEKFFSIEFDDQSGCYESEVGLEAILYEHFNNYYQSIDYSKYDEFLGVYMVDLETASYFAVINWGEAHEDEDGDWSFKYTHTTAEYNGGNISDPFLKNQYGGEHPPDMNEMEQFLIQNQKSTKQLSQKGSKNNIRDLRGEKFFNRDLRGEDFSYADLRGADFDGANCTGVNFEGANLEGAYLEDCDKANFKGANLKNAYISSAKGADFTDTDFSECRGGRFDNAIYTNATMGGNLNNNGISFSNIDFTNLRSPSIDANREEVLFSNCIFNDNYVCVYNPGLLEFVNCKFTNDTNLYLADIEDLNEVLFTDCDLTGIKLKFAEDSCINDDFTRYNFNLVGAIFVNVYIGGADFSGLDLTGADFTGADTESDGVNFSNANLTNANFSNANLTNANFSNANLTNANLSGANLTDANLEGIITDENTKIDDKWRLVLDILNNKLQGRDLTNTDLSGANLSNAYLEGANLTGADLSDADLSGTYLRGIITDENTKIDDKWRLVLDILNNKLQGRDLTNTDLSGANLSNAYLEGANLTGANLSGANLSGTYLSGADLSGADLRRIITDENTKIDDKWRLVLDILNNKLQGRDLTNTDLSGANFNYAYLEGANLSGADLSGAHFYYANLRRANLSGANLSGANLEGIITDENTKIDIPEE